MLINYFANTIEINTVILKDDNSQILPTCAAASSNECVYTLCVQTGSVIKAITDSKIFVTLGDSTGNSVWISNIRNWGIMGPEHDYFEWANTDIFTGLGQCIGSPICRLNVTFDGSGDHHRWYCDYIEVTTTGPHKGCSKSIFYVYQWLATDAPPCELSAFLDGCKDRDNWKNGSYVVKKPIEYGPE